MALVTNIQGYSIHDGPGIRTVVFLKGCGLRCKWCANPECISGARQTGFIASLCAGCGKCAGACGHGAIRSDPGHRVDYELCAACGACVKACSYGALVGYGTEMSAGEVFEAVRRDKIFYEGGGGVTASGGEPLLFPEFVAELFELCREDGFSTCLETSGFAETGSLMLALPVTDHLLFDIKLLDGDLHIAHTGQPNDLVLENARRAVASGADVLFRMPLIPGVNDDARSVEAAAGFLRGLQGEPRLQLMPFHRLGDSKYRALGLTYEFGGVDAISKDAAEEVRRRFTDAGVECSVSS